MGNGASNLRIAREVALGDRVAPRELAALLEHAARLIHGAGHRKGLVPAQWTALRYFARAGVEGRTVAGLMRFQNMALSPVARTVRLLVEKGLLERLPNPKDRRADLIAVTASGLRLLEDDPSRGLEAILGEISPEQSTMFFDVLQSTIRGLLATDDSEIAEEAADA